MVEPLKTRSDLVLRLPFNAIGAELGVAAGKFSVELNDRFSFKEFWCIDKWDDHHNLKEYLNCIRQLPRANIIRAKFEECLPFFSNGYFDFIYIDGYAHTGQDGGKTLSDWWPKLKKGGIFAGHDYDQKAWKKTCESVDKFCESVKKEVKIIKDHPYDSWWIQK